MIKHAKQLLLSSAILAAMSIATVGNTADLTASSSFPGVVFDDTDRVGNEWSIRGTEGLFNLYDYMSDSFPFLIYPSANSDISFGVGSTGNITLAKGSVFIDRSAKSMGIGTTIPLAPLHIKGSTSSDIRLEQIDTTTWDLNPGSSGLWFNRRVPTLAVGVMQLNNDAPTNSIVANATGVGVGTDAPTHALHISNPTKRMLFLDNTAGSSSIRRLLQMTNKGSVGFEMTDRDIPVTWQFRSGSSGDFLINNQATSGSELTLAKANGNLTVKGSVTAQGILLNSSKHSKTDISLIKASEVMAKLKKVEVAEWRYKTVGKNDRHISPMAEDFYSLFKLGPDNKYINPNDLASVAIIAAKELQKENAELKEQLTAQQQRLTSLEKLVTNLALGQGLILEKGNKVVLK